MCGIAGLFGIGAGRDLFQRIGAMTQAVAHRGPDDEGYLFFSQDGKIVACGGSATPDAVFRSALPFAPTRSFPDGLPDGVRAALGHRRLSIVDVSPGGHQPMCSANRRFWVVYNGEIYNHIELRHELKAAGHKFITHSDTEVLLAAYREWGRECLHRFNGMFAFILLDIEAERVFIARDRFGVKPLYFWPSPAGFLAFASEIKQFTVLPGWSPLVNGQRAYDFLNWGLLDHTEETMFHGVSQLRGGEYIECGLDELHTPIPVHRWYKLPERVFSGSFNEACHKFRELFTDAIRLRLRADVAVGSCLSGGLDSSSIVCLANQVLRSTNAPDRQCTFSACATDRRFDERNYMEEVVKATGVKAYYTYPSLDGLFDSLAAITWHQDEPFGSSSIYAQWNVFKLAAESQVKVLLDGQGADELLAGYHGFFGPHFSALFTTLQWGALWREIKSVKQRHGLGYGYAAKQIANMTFPEFLRQPLLKLVGRAAVTPEWLNHRKLAYHDDDPYASRGRKTASVNKLAASLLTSTGIPMLLHWEDRNSMAHSIESRVPFLDYRLVEFLMGLPPQYKLSEGITKRVMREALRGVLPEKIRGRMDKMGFVTPEEAWLREQNPELFRNKLSQAIETSQGILNRKAMNILERQIAGQDSFSFLVWRMISFGHWMEQFDLRVPS